MLQVLAGGTRLSGSGAQRVVHHACRCKLQSYYRAPVTTTCSNQSAEGTTSHADLYHLITPNACASPGNACNSICMPVQVARQSLRSLVSSLVLSAQVGKIRLASDEASRAPNFAREEGYRASTICTSSHVRLLFNNCFIGMF